MPDEVLRSPDGQRVTFAELFFDLVYVVAVTQLASRLVGELTPRGALETLLLLLAVWWAWISTAWFTNWFDPDERQVRIVLVLLMMASLVMSAAIPEALGDRGMWFAGAYVAIQCGRTTYAALALRHGDETLRRNHQRSLVWHAVAAIPWIAGAAVQGPLRVVLWVTAVGIDYVAPAVGFRTPRLGRSTTEDWAIGGVHLAERCQLFLIVAFGESILATGATFADDEPTATTVLSLAVAFAGNVALWWVYFDRHAGRATDTMDAHDDPGRLGRSAYTYLHVPMVAGIIVTAVGDEFVMRAPQGYTSAGIAAAVLGGPALFLAGHVLFKIAVFGIVSVPRLLAIVALAGLAPLGGVTTRLVMSLAAALVVAGVAVWDLLHPPALDASDADADRPIAPTSDDAK